MPATLDDVLLRLEAEVREESMRNPDRCLFVDLECDQVLAGKVFSRHRAKFARICQELGMDARSISRLVARIKWLG